MFARDARGTLRNVWTAAVLLSLLLHAALLAGLRAWTLRTDARAEEPRLVEVVFARDLPADLPTLDDAEPAAATPDPAEPHTFTELPADRADAPPERADYLSNVTSRARDLVPGGEDASLPASPGRADFPQVAMAAGGGAAQPAAPSDAEAAAPGSDAAPPTPGSEAALGEAEVEAIESAAEPATEPVAAPAPADADRVALTGRGLEVAPPAAVSPPAAPPRAEALPPRQGTPAGEDPLADFRRPEVATPPAASPGAPGNADINQMGMASPDGNVRLLGEVSLNTSAWVYGYWMQRFRRAVEAHWNAPYAFQIGMIKGWTLVGLEVSRTGQLLKLEVLDEEGHWTLRDASVAAIQAAAPFEPLPPDSPEQSIRLQIRMTYADYR